MVEGLRHRSSSARPVSGDTLAGTRLLSPTLSGEERSALNAAALPPRAVAANVDLLREGGVSEKLFVIVEGLAFRYKITPDGGRQIVALLVPGDVANLDALVFDRSDYGVRVAGGAKVVALYRDRVLALAEQHAGIATTFAKLAMLENAILSQWALCQGRQTALQRAAHLFCELAVRLAGDKLGCVSFELPLTQEQLGDALGLTAVHTNRTMKELRSLGLVETGGRSVTLPNVARLREVASFNPAYLHLEQTRNARVGGRVASSTPAVML